MPEPWFAEPYTREDEAGIRRSARRYPDVPWNRDVPDRLLATLDRERVVNAALVDALKAAKAYIPGSEVRSWPPGFALKKKALELIDAALALAEKK